MESRPTRRNFFGALAIGTGGLGAGMLVNRAFSTEKSNASHSDPAETALPAANDRIPASGEHQAGIAVPDVPQTFALSVVADVPDAADIRFLPSMGERLLEFVADAARHAGDLTVTIGVGPRVVAAVDEDLEGAAPLPEFAGDTDLDPERTGGDLLLIASASDPSVLPTAVAHLLEAEPGIVERWRQFGFRGPGADGIVRNPFGFHDGIIVPRGSEELDHNVWLNDDPRTAGGTIAVIRRLRTDIAAFGALSTDAQEAAVGRRRADGAPLSGGSQADEASLTAKTPDGQYLTPLGSHVRSAHPAATGSALMLRRGYSYADGDEVGLVFTCFQRDLRTFVATQHRLDEQDEMMRYVTTTASASFLVLPGFDAQRPLGSTLLGA